MNNGDQLKKAHATQLHHTSLLLACQDLESATYAARKAREDLRRATRNRLQAKERHDDAKLNRSSSDRSRVRVDFARWALRDMERDELDALEDYRSALKRLEVLGAAAGEADSHDVPAYVRHRARKAIALADAFGNKVAMDGTLHEGLERPRLPELSPEVEVTEFAVIDPLEPVEAWTPPEPRAVLVPVDDYTDAKIREGRVEAVSIDGEDLEDPAAGGWKPEHMSPEWWKQVTFSAPLNTKDPLPATDEDDEDEK